MVLFIMHIIYSDADTYWDFIVYPPGPGWIFVVVNGIPSEGQKTLIGNGASPPVDQGAIDK
jgi:hypothetical protein